MTTGNPYLDAIRAQRNAPSAMPAAAPQITSEQLAAAIRAAMPQQQAPAQPAAASMDDMERLAYAMNPSLFNSMANAEEKLGKKSKYAYTFNTPTGPLDDRLMPAELASVMFGIDANDPLVKKWGGFNAFYNTINNIGGYGVPDSYQGQELSEVRRRQDMAKKDWFDLVMRGNNYLPGAGGAAPGGMAGGVPANEAGARAFKGYGGDPTKYGMGPQANLYAAGPEAAGINAVRNGAPSYISGNGFVNGQWAGGSGAAPAAGAPTSQLQLFGTPEGFTPYLVPRGLPKKKKGGLGGFLGKVLPIAASFIPGIGPLGMAAVGAVSSGLQGGNPLVGAASSGLRSYTGFAEGGSVQLKGKTGGRTDAIPAKLSDGEYVIPADIVSALGEGNTSAGADALDNLVTDIRQQNIEILKNLPPPKYSKMANAGKEEPEFFLGGIFDSIGSGISDIFSGIFGGGGEVYGPPMPPTGGGGGGFDFGSVLKYGLPAASLLFGNSGFAQPKPGQNISSYDQLITQTMQDILRAAGPLAQQPYQAYPYARLAPYNDDQMDSFQIARNTVGKAQPLIDFAGNQVMGGGKTFPQSFQEYMNPYLDQYYKKIEADSNRNLTENTLPGLQDVFIRANSFGQGQHGDMVTKAIRDNQDSINSQKSEFLAKSMADAGRQFTADQESRRQGAQNALDVARLGQSLNYSDASALDKIGGAQRDFTQQNLDLLYNDFMSQSGFPKSQLDWLSGILRGVTPSSPQYQTTRAPQNSGFQDLIGALTSGINLDQILNRRTYADGGRFDAGMSNDDDMELQVREILQDIRNLGTNPNYYGDGGMVSLQELLNQIRQEATAQKGLMPYGPSMNMYAPGGGGIPPVATAPVGGVDATPIGGGVAIGAGGNMMGGGEEFAAGGMPPMGGPMQRYPDSFMVGPGGGGGGIGIPNSTPVTGEAMAGSGVNATSSGLNLSEVIGLINGILGGAQTGTETGTGDASAGLGMDIGLARGGRPTSGINQASMGPVSLKDVIATTRGTSGRSDSFGGAGTGNGSAYASKMAGQFDSDDKGTGGVKDIGGEVAPDGKARGGRTSLKAMMKNKRGKARAGGKR